MQLYKNMLMTGYPAYLAERLADWLLKEVCVITDIRGSLLRT